MDSTPWSLGIIVFLFGSLNFVLYLKLGINVVADSPRYMEYAEQMKATGFYFDPHNFWYIAYPLYLIAIKNLHNSIEAVVVAQYIFSLIGIICLYFTSLKLFDSKSAAFITGLLMVLFFKISIFNSYILTESLYISMICISLVFLSKWYSKEFDWWTVLGVPILVFTIFLKPTGIAVIVSLLAYVLYVRLRNVQSIFFKTIVVIGLSIPFLLLINKMLSTFNFIDEYQRGDLIYGMFQYPEHSGYSVLSVKSPDNIHLPNGSHPPLVQLFLFVIYNPLYWLQLFGGKLFYLFAHIRPFWSVWHNLFSILFLIPVYMLSSMAIIRKNLSQGAKIFSVTFILVHAFSVGMMTDDWDGRFLLPVLPMVFIWAGLELKRLFAQCPFLSAQCSVPSAPSPISKLHQSWGNPGVKLGIVGPLQKLEQPEHPG